MVQVKYKNLLLILESIVALVSGIDSSNQEDFVNLSRRRRASVHADALLWPGREIPYVLDEQYFTKDEIKDLMNSIKTWQEETCVVFRLKRRSDEHWLRITDGTSCYSQYIGFGNVGEQVINFSKNGCRYYGLYTHEFGHVIGLDHEHIRNDRDRFVVVDVEGVPKDYIQFYEKKGESDFKTYDTPYDLQSIMHYGPGSFSVHANKSPLTVRDPSVRHVLREIYTKDISFWDAKAVNLHYKCQDKCKGAKPNCVRPGYIDQNCKCQTPSVFAQRRCVDNHGTENCVALANKLECYRNASFMAYNCRKTCHFCYRASLTQISIQSRPKCSDHHENCMTWADDGQCEKNPNYMNLMCPMSCKKCAGRQKVEQDRSEASAKEQVQPYENTYIHPGDCEIWANEGYCVSNRLWMLHNCAASCAALTSEKFLTTPTTPAPTTTTTPKPTTTMPLATCADHYGQRNCQQWKAQRMCEAQPDWMKRNCAKSCGYCKPPTSLRLSTAQISTKTPATTLTKTTANEPRSKPTTQVSTAKGSKKAISQVVVRPLPSVGVCSRGDPAVHCPSHYQKCSSVHVFRMCPNICGNCGKCEDRTWNCDTLKKHGYCEKYTLSTVPYCRKTCGACDS